MLGDSIYWGVLLSGTLWASIAPARTREWGLALLAIAWVASREPLAAAVFFLVACMAWLFVRDAKPRFRTAGLVIAVIGGGLLASEIAETLESGDWVSPLGLSYFSFRLIHVVVDARRGALGKPPELGAFLHFIFTPALYVAGPLERWGHWDAEPKEERSRQIAEGIWRIVIGLLKKIYLADMILLSWATRSGWAVPDAIGAESGGAEIWQACLFAYLKIYFEFSGYSNIAVGAGLLWGRKPMENFNWPILAASPADFWRRWHISIAQWCANCIYLPVMGWARGVIVPMMASFVVMGLWHGLGWNRVGWALWQVAGLLVFFSWQKKMGRPKAGCWRTSRIWKFCSIAMTQAFVVASYAFMLKGETVPLIDSLRLIGKLIFLRL